MNKNDLGLADDRRERRNRAPASSQGSLRAKMGPVNPSTPDKVLEDLLAAFFGRPSLVVSTFLIVNFIWSWWSLGRSALSLGAVIASDVPRRAGRAGFKAGAATRLAIGWALLYVPASFVTQLWAGSSYSPGQGGGLAELLRWSAIFGAIAVLSCFAISPSVPPRFGDKRWAPLSGLFLGYLLGAAWAAVGFTMQGGPENGDWWVAPSMSLVGVLGATLRMRISSIKSWRQ